MTITIPPRHYCYVVLSLLAVYIIAERTPRERIDMPSHATAPPLLVLLSGEDGCSRYDKYALGLW